MDEMNRYIDYRNGTSPIILSVPHDGRLECETIPKRETGIFGYDKGTRKLANELSNLFAEISKQKTDKSLVPSLIASKLRRSKIDFNRSRNEAYRNESTLAKGIFSFYHDFIRKITIENIAKHNVSILLDIHGFESHKRPPGFRDVDVIIGTDNFKSIYPKEIPKKQWNNTIRGRLIYYLLDIGVAVAPGGQWAREIVLTGGYIIKQHGASSIPKSMAIQIEFSDKIRLRDNNLKEKALRVIAEQVHREIEIHHPKET
ncbi:MAG: hypothetical protein ACFFAS_12225 [Promethearchaeota archaeon]